MILGSGANELPTSNFVSAVDRKFCMKFEESWLQLRVQFDYEDRFSGSLGTYQDYVLEETRADG